MKSDSVSSASVRRDHGVIPSSLRSVFIIAASVMVMMAACLAATGVLIHHYSKSRPMQAMQPLGIILAPNKEPLTHLPGPTLELDDGHADFVASRQKQIEKLNTCGWVDRTNGIARIPIENAMDLIVARGLPVATNLDEPTAPLKLQPHETGGLP